MGINPGELDKNENLLLLYAIVLMKFIASLTEENLGELHGTGMS